MRRLETVTGAYQNLARKDARRIKRKSDADLVSWLHANYKPMETPNYTKPQETAREAIRKCQSSMFNSNLVDNHLYVEEAKHGSTWRIGVSWEKVREAGGKRISEYAPIKIMGMSANVVSS